jgi:fructose-1,6-bisphosphatase/inositol monophosphatase family enzyme
MIPDPDRVVAQLKAFQRATRQILIDSRRRKDLHAVTRDSAADTIYAIDAVVEPVLEEFCREWANDGTPLVLIAEGVVGPDGREGVRVFPEGGREEDAHLRLIVDPIDGTRGIMYDKRAAWALAGVAPNNGPGTSLRDIEVAVMTELPTSKMGLGDVLWAVKGRGARAERVDLNSGAAHPLALGASRAGGIEHGFASVANFFPGTKRLASELMEQIAAALLGPADVTRATVFDDQYISTGGQFYELIVGHDRFNADLRPHFYRMQGQPEGLCCHPYDCATMLIAEEAGVILTDGLEAPLDGPLDVTSGISWTAYANEELRRRIEPVVAEFLSRGKQEQPQRR